MLRRPISAALCGAIAFTLAACSHGSAKLEGKWKGTRADGVPVEAQAAANAFAIGTELEFKSDAITVKTPKDKQSGKYKVVREDKQSVVITTDRDGADDKQTFTFDGDKSMKWTVADKQTISFARE